MSSPWHSTPYPPVKMPRKEKDKPTPQTDVLSHLYGNLRLDCIELEELIGAEEGLTAKDLKRLDKAVTVIKVGFKIIKMVLRAHGYRKLKPTPAQSEPVE